MMVPSRGWQRRLILRYSSLVLILMPTAKPGGIFASMVMSSLMDRELAPASPFGSEPAPSKPIKSVPFYRKNLCPMGEFINERSCLSEAHYDFTRNRTLSPPERTR